MNLFVEALATHISSEWDQAFTALGTTEVRFIVQSLGPGETLALFKHLDTYAGSRVDANVTRCYFRTATNLWQDWDCSAAEALEAVAELEQAGWIDQEDQLTRYRNCLARDEGVERLVVVLVGLNHATDQGGLADFHLVDERRILNQMNGCFRSWLERAGERLGLSPTETQLQRTDDLLQALSQLRPLQLGRLANFLEPMIQQGGCSDFKEFRARIMKELPSWNIPPLLADASGALPDGKQAVKALKQAEAFISHQIYKTPANQKRDLAKLKKAIDEKDFVLPTKVDGRAEFNDKDDYESCLRDYIERADPMARQRLLRVDAMPMVAALNRRDPPGTKKQSTTVKAFDDLAIIAFLQALWDALEAFQAEIGKARIDERLGDLTISLAAVEHDYPPSEDGDIEERVLGLLWGLLGGLDARFRELIEALSERWNRTIKLDFSADPTEISISPARGKKRPSLMLCISIADVDGDLLVADMPYRWYLDGTQPERVRHDCIAEVKRLWDDLGARATDLLPAFQVGREHLTALFFAADPEEANRLVASAMQSLKLADLREGLPDADLAPDFLPLLKTFNLHYHRWLDATLEHGFFSALQTEEPKLRQAYLDLCDALLDPSLTGSIELLRRVYKTGLVIDDQSQPADTYLANGLAWGLSPPVLEQCLAQTRYLLDGFPEVVDELAERGVRHARGVLERLFSLARIQRPLSLLVTNNGGDISTRARDLGLLHCLGKVGPGAKSLAVQTLLREDDSDDEEDLHKVLRPCEEQPIVREVLRFYAELHDFAADGVRILAANVSDLSVILGGVGDYLEEMLKEHPDDPPFECTLMVYSTSASPLAMENRLTRWREDMLEARKEGERRLLLRVGHRYAPPDRIAEQARGEGYRYDLAFLFHFLRAEMDGKIEAAPAFDAGTDGFSDFFPIAEYPRPIQSNQPDQREMLLSNRRLRVQTRHADLSARLRYSGDREPDHLVLGQVSFKRWMEPVHALHRAAQWVACIDSFVDKRLIGLQAESGQESAGAERKIVGFESGLGDYGELNLTISTEQDTLERLTRKVVAELRVLLPHQPEAASDLAAARVVADAEEIAGLDSLRAVLGRGEQIREVVGYAAIRRMFTAPNALIAQLLPLDAMRSWLAQPEPAGRPDLLHLALVSDADGVPAIHATVIECKVAGQNSVHVAKALQQVRSGLFQLCRVLAPRCGLFAGLTFDRRYWWAQLQRAIASRGEVKLSPDDWTRLNAALEQVAEGQYRICWRAMVFTFWTDVAGPQPEVMTHVPHEAVVPASVTVPSGFCIEQVALGHQGVVSLFAQDGTPDGLRVAPSAAPICIDYEESTLTPSAEIAVPPAAEPVDEAPPEENPPREDLQAERVDDQPADAVPMDVAEQSAMAEGAGADQDGARVHQGGLIGQVPDRIFIGTRRNGEPVYWHFGHPGLENRHLLVFGTSGSGKTYGIQCLLAEMAASGMRSLIVDYTDGFLPAQVEPRFAEVARPQDHFVISERLPLNPFRRQRQQIDPSLPLIEESNYQVASRIVSIFNSVYTLGEQQIGALSRSLRKGLEAGSGFSLDALIPILVEESSHGLSLANKIEPFIQARPFRVGDEPAWERMLTSPEHWVHILQLKGLGREIQRLVTEFILWDLWDHAQNSGGKDRPLPIVLDEIQNLDHSSDSPIDKMLREGRKFGISLILATQTTSNFNAQQRDRLFMAGHKLFFKPADTEIDRFAQILAQAVSGVSRGDWAERLAKLEKGQCWSLGPGVKGDGTLKKEAVLVSVTALGQRQFSRPFEGS